MSYAFARFSAIYAAVISSHLINVGHVAAIIIIIVRQSHRHRTGSQMIIYYNLSSQMQIHWQQHAVRD